MTNKLFVGGLPYSATDAELQAHFAAAGSVLSAKVITDRYSGQGKGFGFVEMSTPEEAQKAIQELNGSNLGGRSIVVNEAKPQEPRDNNRGGSGGGGYNRDNNRGGGFDRNKNRDNSRNRW